MQSIRVGLALLVLLGACAACTGDGDPADESPGGRPSPRASGASRDEVLPHSGLAIGRPIIDLECSDGATVPIPEGPDAVGGIATGFFGWQPENWRDSSLADVPTVTLGGRRFYQYKSPITVEKDAGPRTRITLVSPASGRLFYTDWGTWAALGAQSEQGVIADQSSSVVSVPQCGVKGWTVPGVVLLEGPTCVTFRVAGTEGGSEVTRAVPFYRERC